MWLCRSRYFLSIISSIWRTISSVPMIAGSPEHSKLFFSAFNSVITFTFPILHQEEPAGLRGHIPAPPFELMMLIMAFNGRSVLLCHILLPRLIRPGEALFQASQGLCYFRSSLLTEFHFFAYMRTYVHKKKTSFVFRSGSSHGFRVRMYARTHLF